MKPVDKAVLCQLRDGRFSDHLPELVHEVRRAGDSADFRHLLMRRIRIAPQPDPVVDGEHPDRHARIVRRLHALVTERAAAEVAGNPHPGWRHPRREQAIAAAVQDAGPDIGVRSDEHAP